MVRMAELHAKPVHRDAVECKSDKDAAREGDAVIRRGKGASDNKAFHDSILWNRNVRKTWIRKELELSVQAEILKVYLREV